MALYEHQGRCGLSWAEVMAADSPMAQGWHKRSFDEARAALAAMRNPTLFMVTSAAHAEHPTEVWQAMIDAALLTDTNKQRVETEK